MGYQLIGAVLVFAGCGGLGFQLAASHRRETATLMKLIHLLDFMTCELQYRLTALPDLCRLAARETDGVLNRVFTAFSEELESQLVADVSLCMNAALLKVKGLPGETEKCLRMLGGSLGRFDLPGQVQGLEAARSHCRQQYEFLTKNQDDRLRSYQTLGLCAGAALAILFI